MSAPATIGFLSDYGLRDEFVGVCHAVISRRCPHARVIDITHGIARQDVRAGALALAAALPFLAPGVALAVVDPGVGGARRAIALLTREQGWLLVGPDNGLLSLAAERFGGAAEAVDVGSSRVRLEPVSRTFHGRDIFAPVAAALACGEELASLGPPVATGELCGLQLPVAEVREGVLVAHVVRIDAFGNASLDARPAQLAELGGAGPGASLTVRARGSEHRARYASAFVEVPPGALLLYEDSQGALALAVNQGSAAELLGLGELPAELLLRAR